MKKTIDARGLACPQPVILTKKAIEAGEADLLEIIVDNEAANENVSRLVQKSGLEVKGSKEKEGDFFLYVPLKDSVKIEDFDANEYPCPVPQAGGKVIFIRTDKIGLGDNELGAKLMQAFVYTLTELDNKPAKILFMNAGVSLCLNDYPAIDHLKTLAANGCELLVCGTCLDWLGVKDKLAVGRVSNMYDIAGAMLEKEVVVTI